MRNPRAVELPTAQIELNLELGCRMPAGASATATPHGLQVIRQRDDTAILNDHPRIALQQRQVARLFPRLNVVEQSTEDGQEQPSASLREAFLHYMRRDPNTLQGCHLGKLRHRGIWVLHPTEHQRGAKDLGC